MLIEDFFSILLQFTALLYISKCNWNTLKENILLETMFEVPGSHIVSATVTKETVLGLSLPQYTYNAEHLVHTPDILNQPIRDQSSSI